jgi:hypothetical protein
MNSALGKILIGIQEDKTTSVKVLGRNLMIKIDRASMGGNSRDYSLDNGLPTASINLNAKFSS